MKEFIGGKKITKQEALKGLGDPSEWEAHKQKVLKEFRKKPSKVKKV